jgi:hypothetical protein
MTDQQLLTLTLSLVIPISLSIAALIYSNGRITEAKETLRAEIKAETATLRAEIKAETATLRTEIKAEAATLRAEMAELRAHLDSGFDRLEHALKLHELEHHR